MKKFAIGAVVLTVAALHVASARAAWFDSPVVQATVSPDQKGTDPHYINLSEDGAYLFVDWHAQNTALPVELYSVPALKALSGATNRLATASALAGDFFGAGTGSGGWKGGAISSKLGVAIPGSGKSSGALYTAFSVPSFGWKAGETAFQLSGFGDAGFDGFDFNAAGTRLYVNQYASGDRNKILAYDTSALKASHTLSLLSTKTVSEVTRIRNLSCYTVKGRDLIYFGEGAVSGSNNSVYVYDPAEDAVTALVTDATLFDGDIMNVKLSHLASGSPTLYVQTDNGRLHVFLLAPDGKSVTSATPVKSFTPAECAALCGLSALPSNAEYIKFRNFEVTDDGDTAFFLFLSGGASGVTSPGLCVVKSSSAEDAYVSTSPEYTSSGTGNVLFTDYFFGATSRIEVDFQFRDTINGFIFSPWEANSGYRAGVWRDGGTFKYFVGNKASIAGPRYSDTNRHTMIVDAVAKKGYIVTGTTTNETDLSSATFGTSSWPIMFLGAATGSTGALRVNTTHYARAKIYSAKIYEGGVLVRDYVPAIVNGVPCLYDRKNGSIAADTRDGFAQPGFGGDVLRVAGDTYLQIATSGTGKDMGINTGYKMKPASRVEVDCAPSSLTGDRRVIGSWNNNSVLKCLVWLDSGFVKFFINSGSATVTGMKSGTERQTFVLDVPALTSSIVRDGIVHKSFTHSVAAPTSEAGNPLALFADSNNADGTEFQSPAVGMKGYSLKILESGTLVTNFLPFISIDGACMKDSITGRTITPKVPRYFTYRLEATPAVKEGYVVKTADGNAGFLTDWYLDSRSRVECDFALGAKADSQRPFGAWNNGSAALRTLVYTRSGNIVFYINNGTSASPNLTAAATDTDWHKYVIDFTTATAPMGYFYTAGALVASGAGAAVSATTDRGGAPISIFVDNNGSGAFSQACLAGARFHGMKAYESGGLVHDWVPAKKNGDIGIADRLTGEFITGGASFAAAGDLWEAASDAYIQSSGGMAIDTGYHAKRNSRIEVDMMPTVTPPSPGYCCFFGSYGGNDGNAYTIWGQGTYVRFNMKTTAGDSPYYFHSKNIRFTGVVDFANKKQYLKVGGVVSADFTCDYSSLDIADDWVSRNPLGICGAINDTGLCTSPQAATGMRCYAVRIYEGDALVHLFLPYSGVDGVGLRDMITGAKAFKHSTSTGADPVYVAGTPAVTAADVAAVAGASLADFSLSRGKVRTVVADVPGATSYRWTRNGEAAGETADGTLGIGWRRSVKSDVFAVTPVYATAAGETLGATTSFTVTYNPSGMSLVVR